MRHIGSLTMIVATHLHQFLRLVLASNAGKSHDVEIVTRELRANEALQSDRHLLSCRLAIVIDHTQAHINHQHGRGLRRELGSIDLKIFLLQLDWRPYTTPMHCIHQRLLQVKQERIAELIGLALIGTLSAYATEGTDMPPKAIALELVKDILEGFLSNFTDTTGC